MLTLIKIFVGNLLEVMMNPLRFRKIEAAIVLIMAVSNELHAQGVIGGFVQGIGRATGIKPIEDLGRNADEEHRRIKESNPNYKAVEEGATEIVRRPFVVACTIPYQTITNAVIAQCSNWDGRLDGQSEIQSAKNLLIANRIFQENDFNGIQIRWCPLSNAHGMAPDRGRIYLDTSFKNYGAADLAPLLAHEMYHIMQYRRMGSDSFKCEYSRNYVDCGNCQNEGHPLEREAYMFERSVETRIAGIAHPQYVSEPAPVGFPPNFVMQQCSCVGPFPVSVAQEPRCASGSVRANMCTGVCYGGISSYAYVCQ